MSLFLGIIFAWPIIVLLNIFVPDIKNFTIIIAGVIFLSIGIIFKTSVGLFYHKATLENSPSSFWFNLGQSVGFIIFGIII